jgi:hypothetical protein
MYAYLLEGRDPDGMKLAVAHETPTPAVVSRGENFPITNSGSGGCVHSMYRRSKGETEGEREKGGGATVIDGCNSTSWLTILRHGDVIAELASSSSQCQKP